MRRMIAPLVLALSLGACAAGDVYEPWDDPGNPDDVGDPTGTLNEPSVGPIPTSIPEMTFSGVYEITSHLDVARSNVFGETISDVLIDLSNFRDDPSHVILNLMVFLNIPFYSEVWPLIPDFLKDYLEELLDEYVFEPIFVAVPAVEEVVQFIDDLASVTRDMRLVSQLTVDAPNSANDAQTEHLGTEVGIFFRGEEYMVGIPIDWAEMCAAEPHAVVTPVTSPNPAMPQGLIELDQHAFGIPYGAMLMDLALGFYGAGSMGELLVDWVNCEGVATDLVGPDSCSWDDLGIDFLCLNEYVSYSDVYNFCFDTLTGLGDTVEESVRSLTLDIVSFEGGRAKMFDKGPGDTFGDYKVHSLQDGVWLVSMSITSMLDWTEVVIPATFEGVRIGDAE